MPLSANKLNLLCSKNEYTKSESNSQLLAFLILEHNHCVQRTNIQNLKAIHNAYPAIKKGLSGLSFTFTPIITVDYIQSQI